MTTPNIIKETCEGTACIPIQDVLLRRREIQCTGEIDSEAANSLIVQLHYLSIEDPTGEITLFINSPGGEVSSGLALNADYHATQRFVLGLGVKHIGEFMDFGQRDHLGLHLGRGFAVFMCHLESS